MDIKEVAKKGGDAVLEKYGTDHFKKLAKKRWDKSKKTPQNTTGLNQAQD